MKKLVLLIGLIFVSINVNAQIDKVQEDLKKLEAVNTDSIEGWKRGGVITFLLNQAAFSNWIAGGTNNIAGNVGINYDINYKRGDWTWDNKIILEYGLSKTGDQDTRKSADRIELNSLLGKKAFGNWSYSFFVNFRTQFTDGYDYDKDPLEAYPTSGLFKPAYLTFGPGLLWKKHDNLKFNIAPLTSKLTYIGDEVFVFDATGTPVSSNVFPAYGVDPGENLRYELGLYAAGYYKFELMKNVTMENILSLYSNYLEDPQNVDLDYTMNLVMQINKYLSTNVTFQTIYDDNAFQGFQIREVFGLGVNYNF